MQERDDLVNIEGIDPATEMALNSIGIRRFSDFDGHTAETLAQALQTRTGLFITAETIARQDWLGWAEIFKAENAAKPLPENGLALRIQSVQFVQVETPATGPSAKQLLAKINCSCKESQAAAPAEEQIALCVQIHADDEATGVFLLLASQSQRLQTNQTDYRAELQCTIPSAGRYQLFIITFLLHTNPAIAFHRGPLLRVVA